MKISPLQSHYHRSPKTNFIVPKQESKSVSTKHLVRILDWNHGCSNKASKRRQKKKIKRREDKASFVQKKSLQAIVFGTKKKKSQNKLGEEDEGIGRKLWGTKALRNLGSFGSQNNKVKRKKDEITPIIKHRTPRFLQKASTAELIA